MQPLATTLAILAALTASAVAQMTNRAQFMVRGDVITIGQPLGYDAGTGVPSPIVGTIGFTGGNTPDSAPDVFWTTSATNATADTSIDVSQARTTAQLNLPAGATVTYARLYWAAKDAGGFGDSSVFLIRPNVFSVTVDDDPAARFSTLVSGVTGGFYQASADVTPIVAQYGSGPYNVMGVNCLNFVGFTDNTLFAAWSMVVAYELPGAPNRFVQIRDGLPNITNGIGPVTVDGFRYSGGTPKLTIVAYEGDNVTTSDQLLVNGTSISNALNSSGNIFNSTRSAGGVAVTTVGDLPQLTGSPGSMAGLDLDTFNLSAFATNATNFTVQTVSPTDVAFLGVLVSSIPSLPTNATVPAVSITRPAPGQAVVTAQPAYSDLLYDVEYLTASNTWQTLPGATVNTNTLTLTLTDTNAPNDSRLYRVKVRTP